MSYDIMLVDPVTKLVLELENPHHMKGGTYRLGGTTDASLNVTYNYGAILRKVLDPEEGIRALYGKTGAETIPMLNAAAAQLADDVADDYWEATEGNVKSVLLQLKALAAMRPDGVWAGD
jgi:hypothetical protein